jgi:hypothetical protein
VFVNLQKKAVPEALVRLRDYTGNWTMRSRAPTTSLLTRINFRLARARTIPLPTSS